MPALSPASDSQGGAVGAGSGAAGYGVDSLAELERIRANLVALAQVVEDLRTKYNAHTHAGAVAAPPAAEQSSTAYTLS